jgi:hypothetical protein
LADPFSGFGPLHEKRLADLVIKIVEHFLPLFVGTYSAAPYRLAFADFHPERCLGFLPHELDYTHLRMLWRRWKKKAANRAFGTPLTPFGPRLLDRALSLALRLKGDLVPDFRLIDYPVALLSTPSNPALDGRLDSDLRLARDLAEMGVFDARMALYLPLRARLYARCGFSGFEGRHYSLFPRLVDDLAAATDLQALLTLLAFRYVAEGRCTPEHVPDSPVLESERRQVFFGAAIGLPTFYVHKHTGNQFLAELLRSTPRVRSSNRYRGYWRVLLVEYRRALLARLRREAADLVEMTGTAGVLEDLERRLEAPEEASACGRLTRGALDTAGASDPLRVRAEDFNRAAEGYYRDRLRREHVHEAFEQLGADLRGMDRAAPWARERELLLGGLDRNAALRRLEHGVGAENLSSEDARLLVHLILLAESQDALRAGGAGAP